MTVITDDYGDYPLDEEERTNVNDHQGWLVLSPQAKQIIVTSGHMSQVMSRRWSLTISSKLFRPLAG